jgi:hypothetical protein
VNFGFQTAVSVGVPVYDAILVDREEGIYCFQLSFTLKTEAAGSSETSVPVYQVTRRRITEGRNLKYRRVEP